MGLNKLRHASPIPGSFIEPAKGRPVQAWQDGGVSIAYQPPPYIVRRMHEIDPRLSLEWRPRGTNPITRARSGAWRLTLRGQSGAVRGLILWPPEMMDGRFLAYLDTHWLPRLYAGRRYFQTTEVFNEEKAEKAKADVRAAQFAGVDHGELRWHARRIHAMERGAGESGQEFWSVPASLTSAAEAAGG